MDHLAAEIEGHMPAIPIFGMGILVGFVLAKLI
jgi:hypothetical protein